MVLAHGVRASRVVITQSTRLNRSVSLVIKQKVVLAFLVVQVQAKCCRADISPFLLFELSSIPVFKHACRQLFCWLVKVLKEHEPEWLFRLTWLSTSRSSFKLLRFVLGQEGYVEVKTRLLGNVLLGHLCHRLTDFLPFSISFGSQQEYFKPATTLLIRFCPPVPSCSTLTVWGRRSVRTWLERECCPLRPASHSRYSSAP